MYFGEMSTFECGARTVNWIDVCLLRDLMSVHSVLETCIRMVLILPKVTSQLKNVTIE